MSKQDFFCRGTRKILEQDLKKINNPREQWKVERLMPYDIEVRYMPGKNFKTEV